GGSPPRPRRGAAALAIEMPNLGILPVYLKVGDRYGLKTTITVGRIFKLSEITASREVSEVAQILSDEIFKLEQKTR
ncbi:MAG: hypothetical protein AAB476_00490, partial [Patescibacteria group bacterium]